LLVLIRKRSLIILLSTVFIISFSLGVYKLVAHPMLEKWQEEKTVISRVKTDKSSGVYELAAHPMLGQWQQEKIVISRVKTDELVISLTFDDGPVYGKTSAVLDALQRNQVKGTFFMIGQRVLEQPDLVRRIAQEGHEIGNHSFAHSDYNRLDTEAQIQDIYRTIEAIKAITGQQVTLFRPPGGYMSEALIERCKQEGITIAHWTYQQDPKDWCDGRSAAYIANYILKRVQPGQIVILHDGSSNGMQTAQALDILIPKLKDLGYSCVTMSELIKFEN